MLITRWQFPTLNVLNNGVPSYKDKVLFSRVIYCWISTRARSGSILSLLCSIQRPPLMGACLVSLDSWPWWFSWICIRRQSWLVTTFPFTPLFIFIIVNSYQGGFLVMSWWHIIHTIGYLVMKILRKSRLRTLFFIRVLKFVIYKSDCCLLTLILFAQRIVFLFQNVVATRTS